MDKSARAPAHGRSRCCKIETTNKKVRVAAGGCGYDF
jgi:hypothetical protein